MLTIPLRPHLEARLRFEAGKRGLTPEALAAEILTAVLEADRTPQEEAAARAYLEQTKESVSPKLLSEKIHRDRREDLAREDMKRERALNYRRQNGDS